MLPKPKARVLMLVANLPVPPDRRVWHEATALTEAGYEVSVICPKGKGFNASHEVIDGIHIHRYHLPLEASGFLGFIIEYTVTMFWALFLSLKIAFTRGFDVIHACNPPDLYFMLGLFYWPFGKRFVFDHHDLCPEMYFSKFQTRGFMFKLMGHLERMTFWTARVVLATNESFQRIAMERGKKKAEDIFIVRSAPNLGKFKRVEADAALKAKAKTILGYVGIMGNQDGVDYMLEMMAALKRECGSAEFHAAIVGDGPEFENLQAMAFRLGINDVVTFLGYQTGEPLLRAFSSFDIGIIPDPKDAYNDCVTMNKTLEYMAMGVPFVMYPLAQSMMDAGEAAALAAGPTPKDLADAVRALAQDPARQQRMVASGKQRTAELSWDAAKASLLAAYERALS